MGTSYKQQVKRNVPKSVEIYTKNGVQWARWEAKLSLQRSKMVM